MSKEKWLQCRVMHNIFIHTLFSKRADKRREQVARHLVAREGFFGMPLDAYGDPRRIGAFDDLDEAVGGSTGRFQCGRKPVCGLVMKRVRERLRTPAQCRISGLHRTTRGGSSPNAGPAAKCCICVTPAMSGAGCRQARRRAPGPGRCRARECAVAGIGASVRAHTRREGDSAAQSRTRLFAIQRGSMSSPPGENAVDEVETFRTSVRLPLGAGESSAPHPGQEILSRAVGAHPHLIVADGVSHRPCPREDASAHAQFPFRPG